MRVLWIDDSLHYDGSQIQSLWTYRAHGVSGDSIVAFRGSCNVTPQHMVDAEDLRAGHTIYSPDMLHFIVELFDPGLAEAVLYQRMLMVIAREQLLALKPELKIERSGDDLFVDRKKLSISIAGATPVSCKIHAGLNVRVEGVPVAACGLAQWGVEPRLLAERVMDAFAAEHHDIRFARCKARGIE